MPTRDTDEGKPSSRCETGSTARLGRAAPPGGRAAGLDRQRARVVRLHAVRLSGAGSRRFVLSVVGLLDGLLAAYGVFAAGFLMRPLGAAFFGNLGDTRGRKAALSYSVVMMSIAMVVIGLLPTHASIGAAAPIALVLLRLVQGFSVGGESSGTYVLMFETARRDRRGLGAALAASMASLGVMLAALLVTIMHAVLNTQQTDDYGWRILFFVGAGIGLVALIMRLRMAETPSFAAAREAGEVSALPIKRVVRHQGRAIARVFALSAYTGIVWWLASATCPATSRSRSGRHPRWPRWERPSRRSSTRWRSRSPACCRTT
jgi:MFS family permease